MESTETNTVKKSPRPKFSKYYYIQAAIQDLYLDRSSPPWEQIIRLCFSSEYKDLFLGPLHKAQATMFACFCVCTKKDHEEAIN